MSMKCFMSLGADFVSINSGSSPSIGNNLHIFDLKNFFPGEDPLILKNPSNQTIRGPLAKWLRLVKNLLVSYKPLNIARYSLFQFTRPEKLMPSGKMEAKTGVPILNLAHNHSLRMRSVGWSKTYSIDKKITALSIKDLHKI